MSQKNPRPIRVASEAAYLFAIVTLSLSVAMLACADFGVSMIVAPAYLLSKKIGFLTFGQCEYIVQGLLFLLFCILMKKVKPVYFVSFATGLIYGAVLDAWRSLVPLFNEAVTPPGSMGMPWRILLFAVGLPLTSLSIAVFFHTYLYPQVYDFFVKEISARFGWNRTQFKRMFDASFFLISCAMTLLFFGRFVGVGVGTVIITACNGVLIGWFDRMLDRRFAFVPMAKKFASHFAFDAEKEETT